MPEAYTHIRTARAGLLISGIPCKLLSVFDMGANGPDPFFSYNALSKTPLYAMHKLGSLIHSEKCGEFLCALIMLCKTKAQRAYALGFLSHNAADALIHPYVAFISKEGQRYYRPSGHGFYEIALDSTLYKKDKGSRCIPADSTAPLLKPLELAEICALLHDAIYKVFDEDIAIEGLADSFHDFRALHKLFVSRYGVKKAVGFLADTFILKNPGYSVSHMTPARLAKHLPNEWVNPYTNNKINGDVFDLLPVAEQISAAYFKTAYGYWQGKLSHLQLQRLIGSHSYETGLESEEVATEEA